VHYKGAEVADGKEMAIRIVVTNFVTVLRDQNDPDGQERLIARVMVALDADLTGSVKRRGWHDCGAD
jgi:hypothetical protein